MGKIYNVQLNSVNASTITSAYSNVSYNIDWADLLPKDKKFKLTFAFMGALNYGNNNTFPSITTNLLGHTYKPATNGFQNSYYLGHLKPIPVIAPSSASLTAYSNYTAGIYDNPPIYLDNRPRDDNLRVQISNGTGTSDFHENYLSVAGTGTGTNTLTQAGFIITIAGVTTGIITVGTVITPTASAARTITAFITGSGAAGTYLCDTTATISTAVNFAFPADTVRGHMAPYLLNLSFEELDD
jgi:hypothetical protein